jgi:hypothetical protein
LTANVAEQATVTVPSDISFAVDNINISTPAAGATVTVTNIALASATKQLKISVQADSAAFTPPAEGATTWNAGDVTWNQSNWTSGTGAQGTLANDSWNEVATCAADAAGCSTTDLVFTLGANSAVKRSGDHTLSITWTFESVGS